MIYLFIIALALSFLAGGVFAVIINAIILLIAYNVGKVIIHVIRYAVRKRPS